MKLQEFRDKWLDTENGFKRYRFISSPLTGRLHSYHAIGPKSQDSSQRMVLNRRFSIYTEDLEISSFKTSKISS